MLILASFAVVMLSLFEPAIAKLIMKEEFSSIIDEKPVEIKTLNNKNSAGLTVLVTTESKKQYQVEYGRFYLKMLLDQEKIIIKTIKLKEEVNGKEVYTPIYEK